jgi:hypothetical protein
LDHALGCSLRVFLVPMHDEIWILRSLILYLQTWYRGCCSFESSAVDPFRISPDANPEGRINVDFHELRNPLSRTFAVSPAIGSGIKNHRNPVLGKQNAQIDYLLIEDIALLLAIEWMTRKYFSQNIGFEYCDVYSSSRKFGGQARRQRGLARCRKARDPYGKSGLDSRLHNSGSHVRDRSYRCPVPK